MRTNLPDYRALFLPRTFCIHSEPRLYSHNMLMSQGTRILPISRKLVFIERRNARRITIRRNCLTDRNLHFECPSGSNDDYDRRIAPDAVERRLGKCERISPQSDLSEVYRYADSLNRTLGYFRWSASTFSHHFVIEYAIRLLGVVISIINQV